MESLPSHAGRRKHRHVHRCGAAGFGYPARIRDPAAGNNQVGAVDRHRATDWRELCQRDLRRILAGAFWYSGRIGLPGNDSRRLPNGKAWGGQTRPRRFFHGWRHGRSHRHVHLGGGHTGGQTSDLFDGLAGAVRRRAVGVEHGSGAGGTPPAQRVDCRCFRSALSHHRPTGTERHHALRFRPAVFAGRHVDQHYRAGAFWRSRGAGSGTDEAWCGTATGAVDRQAVRWGEGHAA
jgi:hypothetical protein